MKTTIATSIVALFGLERAIACNEIGCQMVAEELGMGFKTADQIDGAPAGCVRFKNKGIFYVVTCANDADCDPDTCTAAKCKAINQQCAKMTFTFGEGASCQEGYAPITSSWEDCRDAALAIGLSDRAVNDVDLEFPWGTSRPKGCFRDGETKKIYFNAGAGGGAEEEDQILCEVGVAATPAPTPDPSPKPTPQPTPRPAVCTQEENIDYNGHDILRTQADDSQLCAKQCLHHNKCSFWTYRPSTRDCWLKHSKAGRKAAEDRVSGNKACGSGSKVGANGKCYDRSKTVAQRDATCAGDLKCARAGFDGRKFGGCAFDSSKKYVAGPEYNHHCCSLEPTVGLGGKCWTRGKNMIERDAVCAGNLVCARKGYDGRDFGACAGHCCSEIPAGAHHFTLRGDTGEEIIRIVPNNFHKATVRLTRNAIKFASMSHVVTVEFTNDAHSSAGDRNVRFAPQSSNSRDFVVQPVGGSVLNAWNGNWKCNTPNENQACGMVRRGEVFAWAGQYQISFIAKNEQCYIGCYVDDGSRDLDSYKGRGLGKYQGRGFDVDSCRKRCADLDLVDTPYAYFGVQHNDQCFCANAFATATQYKKVPDSQCNMGKAPLTRGGAWRNSIYKIECEKLDLPCTDMEINIDYPGNDLNAGGYLGRVKGNLPNAAACRKACANTNGCKSWTFVKGIKGDNCAVKRTTKARGNRRANSQTISGELCATSDSTWYHLNNGYITCNAWDQCQILRSLKNVALKDCKDRCSADSRCASIDWNPSDCHLKTQGFKAAKAAGKWYSRNIGQTSHWSKVTDTNVCWTRLPTGCSKPLPETSSSPAMWFIDPYAHSGTCGKARKDAFNRHCGKFDAVQLWGYSPPAGALLCEHYDLKGRCCQETPGVYNYPYVNSNKCKIGNDRLSSVVVADGCTIQLAQHSAPGTGKDTGKVWTLRGPGEYNAQFNFANDDISSFVIKCERGAAWRRRLAPQNSPLRRLQSEIFGEESEGEGVPFGTGHGF